MACPIGKKQSGTTATTKRYNITWQFVFKGHLIINFQGEPYITFMYSDYISCRQLAFTSHAMVNIANRIQYTCTLLNPNFPSCAARTSHWLCWPLYFLWHGIKYLCNTFSWYTFKCPTCHLYFLVQTLISWYATPKRCITSMYITNDLHLARKYCSFPEDCSLLVTDNVRGQISEHIFAPNGGYRVYC